MNNQERPVVPANLFVRPELSSLVEHEVYDWRTRGDFRVGDVVNDPVLEGVVRVFGPGFSEELPSLFRRDRGAIANNCRDSFLVR